jgi:hypothetical protein
MLKNALSVVPSLCLALLVSNAAVEAAAQVVVVNPDREPARGGRAYHIARAGDTLFDLARSYLGEELMWPLLWSYNPQITNPHWIYPGDIVFLGPERNLSGTQNVLLGFGGSLYPLGGFYTSEEVAVEGRLIYANTGTRLLAQYDTVYLELDDRDEVRVGDEFVLNRVDGRIMNSDREVVAVRYMVAGVVRVTELHEETELVTAEIIDMFDVMERGTPLFLSQPLIMDVAPRPNSVSLEGVIIDHLRPGNLLHEQDWIFLNFGINDGVVPGNRFHIWAREDEGSNFDVQMTARGQTDPARRRSMTRDERRAERRTKPPRYDQIQARLPWQAAGEAMVIYATEDYCTAVIISAEHREVEAGQRVTMVEGE